MLSRLSQRLAAVALFAALVFCVVDYPFASGFLGVALLAYAALSLARPTIWLLALPALLPMLSLAPWSGRFFLEEFDFFIGATLVAALWRGDYCLAGRPRFTAAARLLTGVLLLSHCAALVRGLLPFPAIDANSFSNYYSPYNALRVGKAFLWAVLLIPALLRAFADDREQARECLSLGVCMGLAGTGAAVLWERGVFLDLLYGTGLWGRLQSLTDFSSEYRATGLLADMHTGGEAIDGYLAMAWPFALGLLASNRKRWVMAVAMAALPVGLYSALVTFSRGTYLAVAVSLSAFGLGYTKKLARAEAGGKPAWPILPALLVAVAACAFLYGKGGWYPLLAALGILGGTAVLAFHQTIRLEWRFLSMVALFLAGGAGMLRGLLTSKWVSNGVGESLAISLAASLAMLLTGLFVGNRARRFMGLWGLAASLSIAISLIAVCVPIASGSYIKSRFTTTGGDFGDRLAHWERAIELMDPGWDSVAFGMGLGVFPRAYAWGGGMEGASLARLQQEPSNTYLRLSATMDLTLGQRISLDAGQDYVLSIDVRAPASQGRLGISICRRNILFGAWNPSCLYYEKPVERHGGEWQTLRWAFNIGNTGDGLQFGRQPLVLRISNGLPQNEGVLSGERAIDCDNIMLLDRQGIDRLNNGGFEAGLDRWYLYTDFYHLPLHIKNLWVTAYFEQGLFGLAAFSGLGLYAIMLGIRLAARGDGFALAVLASLLGFYAVGLIGTLLDVPRVSFLFFLLQFVLLTQSHQPARADAPHASAKGRSFVVKPIQK